MIPERLESCVAEVLKPFVKKTRLYADLYDELISHMHQEFFELQLQGKPENETVEQILEQFGNPERVGRNLVNVHTAWSKKDWVIALFALWYLASFIFAFVGALFGGIFGSGLGAAVLVIFFTGINPLFILLAAVTFFTSAGGFTYVFISATALGVFLLSGWSKLCSLSVQERERFIVGAFVGALVVCAVTFIASYQELPIVPDGNMFRPVAVAGFPWKAIYFPLPPLGNDTVPTWMWPKFFLDYAVMWGVASVGSFLLRKKWHLSRRWLLVALVAASFLMVQVLTWIVLRFD